MKKDGTWTGLARSTDAPLAAKIRAKAKLENRKKKNVFNKRQHPRLRRGAALHTVAAGVVIL
jgi:hypothetical protein